MKYKKLILVLLVLIFLIVPIVQAGFWDWLSGKDSTLVANVVYESDKENYAEASLKIADKAYKVVSSSDINSDDFSVKVDINGDDIVSTYSIDITGDESDVISRGSNSYFYLEDYGVMEYKGADKDTDDTPIMKFKDIKTDESVEIDYTINDNSEAEGNLIRGSTTYKVLSVSDTSADDFDIKVDMDASNTIGDFNIISSESVPISKNEYFVLENFGILRYWGSNKATADNPVMKFRDEQNGETIEVSYPACSSTDAAVTLKIGGEDYKVISASDTSSDDFDIKVDMDSSGTIGDYDINIISRESDSINKYDYIFLKYYGLVRYRDADKASNDNPVMKFRDEQTGETIEIAYKIMSKEKEVPSEVSEEKPIEGVVPCDGCLLDGKCIPYGTRIKKQFCDLDNTIKDQKSEEESCDNNYECVSNVCVDDKCISQNFIQKIINWFKRLFGW